MMQVEVNTLHNIWKAFPLHLEDALVECLRSAVNDTCDLS